MLDEPLRVGKGIVHTLQPGSLFGLRTVETPGPDGTPVTVVDPEQVNSIIAILKSKHSAVAKTDGMPKNGQRVSPPTLPREKWVAYNARRTFSPHSDLDGEDMAAPSGTPSGWTR